MSQNWIVGLLVALAVGYSVWYELPQAARKRLGLMHRWLGRAPACGSCSTCGKCSGPASGGSRHRQ